jgi:hypothetical protein
MVSYKSASDEDLDSEQTCMHSFSSVQHGQALKDSFNSPFDVTPLKLPLAGFIVEVFVEIF